MKSIVTGKEADKPKTRIVPPPRISDEEKIMEKLDKSNYINQQKLDIAVDDANDAKNDAEIARRQALIANILAVIAIIISVVFGILSIT